MSLQIHRESGGQKRQADHRQKVYAQYSYDAWGKVLTKSGSLADVNPLRYRGYYCDTETGFYYLQSRYYDPIVKRFLNADSYGSTGQGFTGYNMFAYCGNNPISRSDPSGHSWIRELIERVRAAAETVRAAAETVRAEAEKRKEEFLQAYEKTYGKPFYCESSNYFSVGKDTGGRTGVEAFFQNVGIGIGVGSVATAGCVIAGVEAIGSYLIGVPGSTLVSCGISSLWIKEESYETFVVLVGTVDWELIPFWWKWDGTFRGEMQVYKINDDGTLTNKTNWPIKTSASDIGIQPPSLFERETYWD